MLPAVGTRFGRYELLGKLGAGGMGEVYRALDLDLGREVAVKFLPERFGASLERLERFSQEARAASSLNHPNIVTIHEIGEAFGLRFTVMELVDGLTLRQLLRTQYPLSPRRVLDIACQLADGLAQAHAAGIVHRDLKPENVMVTRDGHVKILDFGLAKLRGDCADPERRRAGPISQLSTWPDARGSPHTEPGVVMGTVGYMSPEQARGCAVDHRSDQFGLGAILYELVSGRPPFPRDSPVQTLAAIIEDEPEPLAVRSPAFPAPARWIVERCLAKEPAERYASTLDLARELHSLRAHLPEVGSSGAAALAAPMPRSGSRRRLGWCGLAAALATTLAVLVLARQPLLRLVELRTALPAERHLAVLPFELASGDPEDQFRSDGLAETLTAQLAQLAPFHAGLSIVPAQDVRQAGVTSADAARRTFGATLVVAAQLQRLGDRLRFDARLVDTRRSRVLRRLAPRDQPLDALALQQGVVEQVASLLELPIGEADKRVLSQGSTAVGSAFSLYLQARGHLQRFERAENLERAISSLQQALEQDPGYAIAYAALGEAYFRLYELQKRPELVTLARENCRKALDLNDLLAPVHVTLGMIHRGTGQAREALADLRRALDRDPRSAEAYREMGRVERSLGRAVEAEQAFRKAAELRPSDWAVRNYLGGLLVTANRLAEAEVEFQRVIALAPDNPRGYTNAGAVCFRQGKLEAAERALRRSIEIRPTAPALSNLGTVLFYLGRYDDAARVFEQAVLQDDRNADAWLNLGRAYRVSPRTHAKARAPLERAVALGREQLAVNPRDASLLASMADAHAMLGAHRRAGELAARALELAPADGDVLFVCVSVDEALGRRDAALQKVTRALAAGYALWEIEHDPALEALRDDPRFADAVQAAAREGRPQ
jgi:serine/threonine-protein kinase